MRGCLSSAWLRSFLQPVTYLGVGMSLLILAGLFYLISKDQEAAYGAALRNGDNLARVFEGHISRTIKSADNTLLYLRKSYQRDPRNFTVPTVAQDPEFRHEVLLQFARIGADGVVRESSWSGSVVGADYGDEEAFRVHLDSSADELFISKPLILKSTGNWAIVLSRRLKAPDGSFAGVIAATLDPHQLEKFYSSLDLGGDGIVSLVGFDGIIRARGGAGRSHTDTFGRSVANARTFQLYRQSPTGNYWNEPGTVDPVQRLITYRVVDGLPLIAIVGVSKAEILKFASRNAHIYVGIALTLWAAIAVGIGFGAARERRLASTASKLSRTNMWLETALANMPHGLCMFGADRKIILSNALYGEMYGLTAEQTKPGTTLRAILEARVAAGTTPRNAEKYVSDRLAQAFLPDPGYITNELRDGRVLAISRRSMPDGGSVAIHQDITAQRRAEVRIRHLAHCDGLTDLANRVLFLNELEAAMERCRRHGDRFAVHLLDLDRFKEVNDSLGHVVGDALLKEVARRLRTAVSDTDVVARLGGDEFAVLQQLGKDEKADAIALADKILSVIVRPVDIECHQLTIETSIGIALAPDHGLVAEELLKKADLALYRAKSDGRNGHCLFEPQMERDAYSRHELVADLRNSIARGEFELHYQPFVGIMDKKMVGMEALVRWRHPQRDLVPPNDFIALAEDTGLIKPLGEWILRTACAEAAHWPSDIRVAVNLSAVQFRKCNLSQIIADALRESGLCAERLELEVTESVFLEHNEENLAMLHELKDLGISIVLDDFGTGYSSLSYLQSFPFNKIKIDRTFVADLGRRGDCAAIVSAVTGLAKSLDIATTAEGVETVEQLMLLRAAGCDEAQGYLFGRPCPSSEIDFRRPGASPRRKMAAGA
jgi:diguanylate cyclase (GGDEF)-like protein